MPDFTKLWDATYLFGPNPVDLSRSDLGFFWLSIVFIILGVFFLIRAVKKDHHSPSRYLLRRFFHLFLTMGVFVLLWSGLRQQDIPWLGTRFAVLLILLVWLVWLGFIIRYMLTEYREHQEQWRIRREQEKYLPKHKK